VLEIQEFPQLFLSTWKRGLSAVMARPVEFEYDAVLENAMQQFWKEGFEASSVQKLLDATGINRGTLYNSFGDKDTFFKSCVEKYNGMLKAVIDNSLGSKTHKADKALAAFFDAAVINAPARERVLGCLLVNSVCESIVWNPDIQKILKDSLNAVRKALLVRTRELEKGKQLGRGLSAESAADLLMSLYAGLKVQARAGKTPKVLAEQVAFTLAAIKR
jgi:TetR/AcrR family transcriptional regulator, transcriptional repressor for nem operon